MASNFSDDDFENISKAEHGKITQKMQNMGYKEGITDGREKQFQLGFDEGYEQGYKHGFLLGKYKGSIWIEQSNQGVAANFQNDLILERTSRGQCIICTNPIMLKENSITEIIDRQNQYMNNVKSTLVSRHGPK